MADLKNTTIDDTGFIKISSGNVNQRPTPETSMTRFNTTYNSFEFYDGSIWRRFTGGSVVASGGNSTKSFNGHRIHVFTSPGTFTVTQGGTVEYLIVAGGGGGGTGSGGFTGGGGGGAGGVIFGSTSVTPQSYTITVGSGGARLQVTSNTSDTGGKGSNSSAFGVTAEGGGGGGSHNTGDGPESMNGGSGGGSGSRPDRTSTANNNRGGSGTGIAGQGNPGGPTNGVGSSSRCGGCGGGGAGKTGSTCAWSNDSNSARHVGRYGGAGLYFGSIFGNDLGNNGWFGGGGGGGNAAGGGFRTGYGDFWHDTNFQLSNGTRSGFGGLGGGGRGGRNTEAAEDGFPNTGGAGGGSGWNLRTSGAGGSGIVIIRYIE